MNNSNFTWLDVADIQVGFRVTTNIPQQDIDRAVNEAYEFDVTTKMSNELLNAIKAILITNPKLWNRNTAYVTGNYAIEDGAFYKALANNTDVLPSSDATKWSAQELMYFWLWYVKPFFCACAYQRVLLWHGANFTQFALTEVNAENAQPVSSQRRGELLADVRNKIAVYQARMYKAFSDSEKTFDSVAYNYDCGDVKSVGGFGVFGVGTKTNRKHTRNGDCNC